MRRKHIVGADAYGGFEPAAAAQAMGDAAGVGESYGMHVPGDVARDVTPPQLRGGAARREAMHDAYVGAFAGAAASAHSSGAVADDGEEAVCPVFGDGYGDGAGFRGARRRIVLDERGDEICWPWEGRREESPPEGYQPGNVGSRDIVAERYFAAAGPRGCELGSHAADAMVQAGLAAATTDGNGGENSTGVRAYKAFCRKHQRVAVRPIDPNAPLWVKLAEEVWAMRFISETIQDRTVQVATARGYFGAVNRWHVRKTGIGFAAGMDMQRLSEMVKGLKNLYDGPPRQLCRGIAPQTLRRGMDAVYPPVSAENCNIRAMLATGLQGLMRGRELGCEGRFDGARDIARGDISTLTKERFAFFMRPAKNMRHRRGKTVPLVIGGGGECVDACFEVQRMLEMDPTPVGQEATTPMFRKADGAAFTTDDIRNVVRQLCVAVGEDPLDFGAHSLRIGGATALFAAGADPLHIRTMGRWSSDCYRLYVRACFEQTIAWTRKLGSQQVHDVQGTYERNAQEVEEY